MSILVILSNLFIPFIIFYVVVIGLIKKQNIYDDFIEGAKEGIKTVIGIMPTLIGLMVAVGILRSSGFMEFIADKIKYVTEFISFPAQLVPLVIVRMFSSSAATSLALDIFKEYGTDSYVGMMTSIIMSCTETIFYTMSVYFISAKVSKQKWTLAGAIIATIMGIAASVILAGII